MNAKQAKRLRKLIRSVAAQQTAEGNPVNECSYQENAKNRKVIEVPKGQGSEETEEVTIAVGTVTVTPNTVKGLYKRLKKAYNKAGDHKLKGKRLVTAV